MGNEVEAHELENGERDRMNPNPNVEVNRSGRGTWRRAAHSVVGNGFTFSKEHKDLYYEKYTCKPNCSDQVGGPPIFIVTVTLVEIAVFIFYAVTGSEQATWWTLSPGVINSPLIFSPYHRQEAWRFLTYMFLHAGIVHIMSNCFMQLLLGIPLEMVHGSLRIMGIYMIGVIAGSLGSSVFDVGTYLVGASGGDFALLFAFLANVIVNWDSMKLEFAIFRVVGVSLLILADFGSALYRRYGDYPDNGKNISVVAHIAGAVAGLTMGLVLLKNFKKQKWETVLFYISIVLFSILVLVAIFFNIFCPCYDPYK